MRAPPGRRQTVVEPVARILQDSNTDSRNLDFEAGSFVTILAAGGILIVLVGFLAAFAGVDLGGAAVVVGGLVLIGGCFFAALSLLANRNW